MARAQNLGRIFDRLEGVGVSRGFTQRRLMPEWWRDEDDTDPAAVDRLAYYIGELTGIPKAELLGDVPSKTRPVYVNLPGWCGARLAHGGPCTAPPIRNPRTGARRRCRRHGGMSTGARTEEGRARQAEAARVYLQRLHALASEQGGEAA